LQQPQLIELGCAVLRLPVFSKLANHVFFGRGSFPDVMNEKGVATEGHPYSCYSSSASNEVAR
jgi:hypothetical protein